MRNLLFFLALVMGFEFAEATPTTLSIVTLSETAALFAENSGDNVNGNRIANPNCDLFLLLKNSSGAATATVTVTAQTTSVVTPGGGSSTKSDATVSLGVSEQKHVGPFRCRFWNDSSQYVQLTFSGSASSSVKVTPLKLPVTF